MIRATTPTHTFSLPIETSLIKEVLITYKQDDEIVVEKGMKDCTCVGTKVETTLTQEETRRFSAEKVLIQLRILTNDNQALVSDVIRRYVTDVLNDVILE